MADGTKVRITQQYTTKVVDSSNGKTSSVPLHKHGAVGDVVTLAAQVATDEIGKGNAVAV